VRTLFLAVLLLLAPAPAAVAAEISLDVAPRDVRFGDTSTLTGRVTEGGAPVAGAVVVLQGVRYPFAGPDQELARATTDASGAYRFERAFDRNWQVRVALGETRSPRRNVFVFPRFSLSFDARNPRVIELTQRYRVPRGVELEQPTLFYVGRRGQATAPRAATARLRRLRPGQFVSTAVVRIPSAWGGRFRYASCFRYTFGSGMGDPKAKCPGNFRF
jgi:hypothetical protein